jgi:ABC-type phosphate/phosphonate transport system ATPase subunit
MTPAISVAGLSRRYRGNFALDNVSFDIEPGSITGLLGRNGAGKPVTELRRSLSVGDDRYAARRVRPTGIKVHRGCARAALFLSEATVKTHINHIFGKTGLRDRGQLVGYAFRHGLATPD